MTDPTPNRATDTLSWVAHVYWTWSEMVLDGAEVVWFAATLAGRTAFRVLIAPLRREPSVAQVVSLALFLFSLAGLAGIGLAALTSPFI